MFKAKQHLERALKTALAQYAETMGEAFPIMPLLDVVDDPEFWALAKMDGNTFCIRVSTGTVASTIGLWTLALADKNFLSGFEQDADINATEMSHIGLVWLILHELHHFQMGHFEDLNPPHPSKALGADSLTLVERTKVPNGAQPKFLNMNMANNRLCFEMQADHDAIEMLLDAYSPDEWISLRIRVAAISAMMMLIERADAANQTPHTTHPKAATRIFQLIGHLVDMPVLSAHTVANKTNDSQLDISRLASTNEHDRFTSQVIVPAFFDASTLARIACAQSITNDLGSATDFFHDVQIAKLMGAAASDSMTTSGARQWAKLIARNIEMSF